MPRARSATGDEAPQSSSTVRAVSIIKQVLNRPPEPKASPEPMTVKRIALSPRARARRDLAVPAAQVGEIGGHRELGGLHDIDRDQAGDVGDGVMIAGG